MPLSPDDHQESPIQKIDEGESIPLNVSATQRNLIKKEVTFGVEKEKCSLVKALTEYYNNNHECANSQTSCTRGTDDNFIISNGSERETYMSWVIREKHRESKEDAESGSKKVWNPMCNIFRKSTHTQVSSRPSLTEKLGKAITDANDVTKSIFNQSTTTNVSRIRLIGQEGENEILEAGHRMYNSLKAIQQAVHLSELFCFRNNISDSTFEESLNQPGFQQFMESENEMEVLKNIMALLGDAKNDVEMYFQSLREANLHAGDKSEMTKSDIVDNSNGSNMFKDKKSSGEIPTQLTDRSGLLEEKASPQIVPFTCPSCQSRVDLK